MDTCLICSSPFLASQRRRYCSDSCRQVAYRLRRSRLHRTSLSSLTALLSRVQPYELRVEALALLKTLSRSL